MTSTRRNTTAGGILTLAMCLSSCAGGGAETSGGDNEDSLLLKPPPVESVEEEMEAAANEPVAPPEREALSFNDFFFLFLRNKRFQAEHVKFPLEVEEADASERTITSGAAFREYFSWPDGDEYTLILTNPEAQMEAFQSGEGLTNVVAEVIDLNAMEQRSYHFALRDSVWRLESVRNHEPHGGKGEFLRFYAQFATDTAFQSQHLARQLHFTMASPNDEGEEGEQMEGILLPSQWQAFRPEMPQGVITNFNFGQPLNEARRITLLRCGMASGMMRSLTFHHAPLGWELHSFDE